MITLENIIKKFNNKIILNKINYCFEDGQNYAIMGESGSGKTTLLNIIRGYEEPDDGNIFCESQKIEYLFQENLSFSNLTIRENFKIKSQAEDLYIEEEQINKILSDFKLCVSSDQKVSDLSGGERQRFELGLLLAGNPDILLFDEPTAKLDNQNKEVIASLISNQFQNQTVIVVTHEDGYFKKSQGFVPLLLQKGGLTLEIK